MLSCQILAFACVGETGESVCFTWLSVLSHSPSKCQVVLTRASRSAHSCRHQVALPRQPVRTTPGLRSFLVGVPHPDWLRPHVDRASKWPQCKLRHSQGPILATIMATPTTLVFITPYLSVSHPSNSKGPSLLLNRI